MSGVRKVHGTLVRTAGFRAGEGVVVYTAVTLLFVVVATAYCLVSFREIPD